MNNPKLTISTVVPDAQRLGFLPQMFGRRAVIGEALVYAWMRRLSEDYQGGLWNFYTTTNGAMYLAPCYVRGLRISVDGNGFDGKLSADAAGIVATLFALNQLAHQTDEDQFIDLYYRLRDFAATHAEAGLIYQAID